MDLIPVAKGAGTPTRLLIAGLLNLLLKDLGGVVGAVGRAVGRLVGNLRKRKVGVGGGGGSVLLGRGGKVTLKATIGEGDGVVVDVSSAAFDCSFSFSTFSLGC